MKKKLFLLTIVLLCAVGQGAWAESVTFNVRSWDDANKKVVTTTDTKDCTVLAGNPGEWMMLGSSSDQNAHYYVVKGNVEYKTLNCYGKVHLILADNATLTCTGGIKVEQGNNYGKLFVYSQSDGDKEGRLVVTNSYDGAAGIGSSEGRNGGPIVIHGGKLDITGGKEAAGIGAGHCTEKVKTLVNGGVTIYGGMVKAQGGDYGAGIGGGGSYCVELATWNVSDGTTFKLYGGNVTAIGGNRGAGVGGGSNHGLSGEFAGGHSGDCQIYGGTLTAQGGHRGAGIGGGSTAVQLSYVKNKGKIYIEGGTVNATGGAYGAGIGGGCNLSGGTITIAGGTVTAIGGTDGAGIGGGEDGSGGTITISGGTVRAEGRSYGAGIGAGECTKDNPAYFIDLYNARGIGADVKITGGTVIAIAGGDCKARDQKGGSAIGCGQGMDNKDDNEYRGTLTMPGNYRVTAGDAEDNIERVFTTDEREGACIWRNYVKIEACPHTAPTVGSDNTEAVTYTIDGDKHTKHCRYCAYTLQENHTFVNDVCSACGKKQVANDDMWSVTLYRASAAGSNSYADRVVMKVVKGKTFTVSAVSATEGLTLMGYTTYWTGSDGIEMKDNETLTAVGAVITPTADMSLYPRYRYRYVPTWTWDDTNATATLSIVCSALSSEAVDVTNISYTTEGEVKTATGTYDHDGATYTFTDTYLLPVGSVALLDNASNEETLDNYKGRKVKALMLSGRTLYADGLWNTLCLPFSLNETELYTYLNPSAVKTLGTTSYDRETGTLTLNFTNATTIEAGKPYLIKWTEGGNRTNPIFNNVIINNSSTPVTSDYADFCGSFSPVTLEAGNKTVLYLGADNKLYYPLAAMTVGSCRAVFYLNGITAGDLPQQARRFVLNFGDGETATGIIGIGSTRTDTDKNDGYWYDLQGRKLSGKPTQKGIYINHGNKVVIK